MSAAVPAQQPVYEPSAEQLAAEARDRRTMLGALAGIPLSADEHRVLAWLSIWDDDKSATIAELIRRAREAGPIGSLR